MSVSGDKNKSKRKKINNCKHKEIQKVLIVIFVWKLNAFKENLKVKVLKLKEQVMF